MRRLFRRARVLVFGLALIAAFVPAGRADAAGACGYARVAANTVPLLTLCGPGDCPETAILIPINPVEVYACVTT